MKGRSWIVKLAALQAYFEWMPIRPIDEQHHQNLSPV